MNITDFIHSIANKSNLTNKAATAALDATITALTDALKDGEAVQIMGSGTFEVRTRPARTGKNPATGEAVSIPEKCVPVFKAGKGQKDAVQ